MKNTLSFKRGESIKFFNKLPYKEQEIINDYVKYVSITSKSKIRLENNKRNLLTFRKTINKDFDKTTLKDLRNFLSLLNNSERTQASKNDIKHTIKRFLRWLFKDWSERFDELKDIKLIMYSNEEKINSSVLLKKEDIEAIVKATKKTYWKAFFLTLYESGLRPVELRTLTWKNIKFDVEKDGLSEINVYATKTHKARSVYIKEATFYLKQLKEKSDSEYVFPSVRDKNKPVNKELPAVWLKRITQKVLGRQVYPYILRHSRATELYVHSPVPDKVAQKILGHSKNMSDIYSHLSNKDVKEASAKIIYKTEDELPPEKKNELEERIKFLENKLSSFADKLVELEIKKGNAQVVSTERAKKLKILN